MDSELPVNIYDLGLIYDIEVAPSMGKVHIRMTLTALGCPVAQTFPVTAECVVRELPSINEVCVELVHRHHPEAVTGGVGWQVDALHT